MPRSPDDDAPWEDEFVDDNALTKRDTEAVPEPVPPSRTTGKYKTLTGYGVSPDVQSELAFGRGCAHCTKKILLALKLWRMDEERVHPDVAQAHIDRFRMWLENPKNDELVRVLLRDS